ncbi:unnamed protein product [Periconia digitata]|uniref:Uncharacterized protein n=1 Tax=Periconia digitata TaxID=1303443 RepID=A0A9W4XSF9_9PLEO|nr:unnamed protein product [Periconia digitata]
MAAIEEIGSLLHSLLSLKPPGVTKTKVQAITDKCIENVQSDAAIVQKIAQQFKSNPANYKLGVLYVVDSVSRAWLDRARKTGQAVIKTAAPGTFASGVQQITDVLPGLMTELVQCAPADQKEKISKLLDIWERSQTFPREMIAGFKQQVDNPKTNTPPGSPPKSFNIQNQQGLVGQTNPFTVAPAQAPVPAPQDAGALLAALAGFAQPPVQTNAMPAAPPVQSFPQGAVPPPPPAYMPNTPVAPPSAPPASIPGIGNVNDLVAQILQGMQAGTINAMQGVQVLNALHQAQNSGIPFAPSQPAAVTHTPPMMQNAAPQDRYEQSSNRYRDRSRSPDYNGRRRSPVRRSPPNRRDSPTYGAYDPNAVNQGNNANRPDRAERGRGRGKNRGGRSDRSEYRQRTPPAQRRQSPPGNSSQNGSSKFVDWDPNLPPEHIRVLSRTLFVGGAGGTESEIRAIFSRFGRVQTCIVASEKRHAFVKMMTRPDAVAAKDGMDEMHDPNTLSKARQTRWGVGFGPRDCSNYDNGISVIPISRLTDADRKWVVTAEHGGTGGLELQGGMVIEEPDIEIGAGVSSKAISRRVPAEAGRGRGGHSRGGRGGGGGHDNESRFRKVDRPQVQAHEIRHIEPRPEPQVAVPPAIPGFGFQLPGMPGGGY